MSEFTNDMFGSTLDAEQARANQQRNEMDRLSAPMTGNTVIVDDATMKLFKKKVWLFRIVEIFGIRDDSWLTIRRMNDMSFLKKFGVLEPKNWSYLTEVLEICKEKWIEIYHTEELDAIGYELKKEEPLVQYAPVNIKEVMEDKVEIPENPESKVHRQWTESTKKVKQDMNIDMVDIDALEDMSLQQIWSIYKRVTGKGISINVLNNKKRFIDKLTELKHI